MKKLGPWKIRSTQIKYQNPWVSVREDKVIRPDGKNGIFGVVTMLPGISVLPIDNKNFVYLTSEFHYAIGKNSLEVISGGIDKKEKILAAAKRELLEETGIKAKKWKNLGVVNPFTTVIKSPATLFLAQDLSFSKARPEGTEKIKIIKVKFSEALKMVLSGKITHAPSGVLILKAARYLK